MPLHYTNSTTITLFLATTLILSHLGHASNSESVKEDQKTVKAWNDFVADIYQLHLEQIKNRKIKTQVRSGGYYKLPYFFQEIKFYDNCSDKMLSKLEWETRNPDKLHAIEVYVHDKKQRVVRDYSASYLPHFRNAPYQTLINLHHYNKTIHSFRQFDASDNLIYEVCTNTKTNRKIYEHDDYEIPESFKAGVGKEAAYQQCFSALPRTADLYLKPR